MKLVRGMDAARAALAREPGSEPLEVPPGIREGIRRVFGQELTVEQVVLHVLDDVGQRGDAAVIEYCKKFDGVDLTSLEVSEVEFGAARRGVSDELVAALEYAAKRIYDFHLSRKGEVGLRLDAQGVGYMIQPLGRVGVYVPGGRACYPSTVLMTALPAHAAGVSEVVMCTPPGRGGHVPAPTLMAARIARVDRVFKIGGAQAIAAMAFGTESVPGVDKVCGPGNVFVTLAKKAVYGVVDIDGLQGPSELVVVADDSAEPAFCAIDLLAQGEHDPMARVVLIATSEEMAHLVEGEVRRQMKAVGRHSILARSVVQNGMVVVVDGPEQAIELVNLYAPEHVLLMVRDADTYLPRIRNAGCIYVGAGTPPAIGDFVAGPSHVLPTGGTARFGSPLGTSAFLKVTSVVAMSQGIPPEMASAARAVAEAEGFEAHRRSVQLRTEGHDR
ncbi:MAG: histidinol dehydrogenase [Chloroflexota bacterium]